MHINYDFFKSFMVAIFLSFFTVVASDFCNVINFSGAKPKVSIISNNKVKSNPIKHYNLDYPKLLKIFKNRNTEIPNDWKQIDINKNGKGEFYINSKTGFEATAFTKQKEVVMLIRGMHLDNAGSKNVFSEDIDGCSVKSIFFGNLGVPLLGQVPEQFEDANKFYKIIKRNFPDHKIIFVGKSLGGSLAELLGAIYGHETYTFASPGMRYAIAQLKSDYRKKVIDNSKSNFNYIKSYYNINDPCGGYGEHIGLVFVYPPVKIDDSPFYDIHGNINHFASEKALNRITTLPKEWKYKHTAALVYYDSKFKEDIKPISLHKVMEIWFKVKEKDLLEALELTGKLFDKEEPQKEKKKEVVSNFKSNP